MVRRKWGGGAGQHSGAVATGWQTRGNENGRRGWGRGNDREAEPARWWCGEAGTRRLKWGDRVGAGGRAVGVAVLWRTWKASAGLARLGSST